MTAMTPDKVEAALGVLRSVANARKWWLTPWSDGGGNDSPKSALSNFTEASKGIEEALSVLTEALAESRRDAARYRWLRDDPPVSLCVRQRRLFVRRGRYLDGLSLDQAIDAAMKDTDCELSDAEMDATTDYRGHDPDYDRKDTDHDR